MARTTSAARPIRPAASRWPIRRRPAASATRASRSSSAAASTPRCCQGQQRRAGLPDVPHARTPSRRRTIPSWRLTVITQCGTCHQDKLKTYRDTFHGQATELGFRAVATCADCHGNARILPASDPASPIAPGEPGRRRAAMPRERDREFRQIRSARRQAQHATQRRAVLRPSKVRCRRCSSAPSRLLRRYAISDAAGWARALKERRLST